MLKLTVALLQMNSSHIKKDNLNKIETMIEEAVSKGANFVCLSETVNYIGEEIEENSELIPDGETCKLLCNLSKKHNIFISGGSFYEKRGGYNKPLNTTILINSKGEIINKYSKIHPFDVEIDGGVSYKESHKIQSGNSFGVAETVFGLIGFGICYDLRFPEIFRLMALENAKIIIIPANFTYETGKKHWEVLLRARAIENGVFVLAINQTGENKAFKAFGNSMIINPWGEVIERANEEETVIIGTINLEEVEKAQNQTFTLKNRRTDLYKLEKLI